MKLSRFFLIFILLLTSCRSVEIAENLNQYQTHRIITELNTRGISSYSMSSKAKKGSFSVFVNRSDRLPAIAIINNNELLPKPDNDFNELTKSKGFLPNSRAVENLRLDKALSLDIENILSNHPLIDTVKVIVRVNYVDKDSQPSVSAIITTKENKELEANDVTPLIINSIPGVTEDKVTVLVNSMDVENYSNQLYGLTNQAGKILPRALVPFLMWEVPEGVDFELGLAILVLLIIGLLLGYLLGYFSKKGVAQGNVTRLPDSGKSALRIDDTAGLDDNIEL